MDIFHHDLEAVEASCFGNWTSLMKFTARFSFTMPSLAAKNASTCDIKCLLPSLRFSQWFRSYVKVYFLSCPEAGFGFFIHLPDGGILDGQYHKSIFFSLSNTSSSCFIDTFLYRYYFT